MDNNKKYNLKLAALWTTRSGDSYMSMTVDDQVYDAFQQIEKGGKLVFKLVSEERRPKETSPHAYLEYISKEDCENFAKSRGGPSRAKPAKAADVDGI